jgi:methionyl-tRNA synthetase
MSKSKGNIVRARPINKVVGIEGLRYYLLRDIVFGQDGNFSFDALVERYNSDLANGLGNLASRTLAMIQQYFEGRIPAPPNLMDGDLPALASETIPKALGHFEAFEFSRGLEAIWALIGAVDKFIVEQKPWVLAKSDAPADREKLQTALYQAAEVVRIVTALVYPVMPKAASKIWAQLGQAGSLSDFRWNDLQWGGLKAGTQLGKTEAVFPRLDVEESIKKMSELEQDALKEQAAVMGKTADAAAPEKTEKPQNAEKTEEAIAKIGIEDFAKVELRVGVIKSAVKVPKADRLLHLMVDLAEAEPRSIVAGIALAYEPESLIGRKVVVVANLQPRKLRGLESNGMIVAATGPDGKPALVGFHEDAPVGARLS